MTKNEAIIQMQNGHRVKHYLFADDEFIYMKDGHLYDENNYLMEHTLPNGNFIDFWADRQDDLWDDGWIVLPDIVNEENHILSMGSEHIIQFHRMPYYPEQIFPRIHKYACISKNSHKRTNKRKK